MKEEMKKIFDGNFDDILIDADAKYQSKKEKYGESWKNMTYEELQKKYKEEMEELVCSDTLSDEYKELIDVINVLLMISKKVKEASDEYE